MLVSSLLQTKTETLKLSASNLNPRISGGFCALFFAYMISTLLMSSGSTFSCDERASQEQTQVVETSNCELPFSRVFLCSYERPSL